MAAPPIPPRPLSGAPDSRDLAPPVPPLPPGLAASLADARPPLPPSPSLALPHPPLVSPRPQKSFSSAPDDIARSLERLAFPAHSFGSNTVPYISPARDMSGTDALGAPLGTAYQGPMASPRATSPHSPLPYLSSPALPVSDYNMLYPQSAAIPLTVPPLITQRQQPSPRPPSEDQIYDVIAPAVFRPLRIPFAPVNPAPSLGDPPVLTVSLPTEASLYAASQSVKSIENPSRQLSWSKQVLDLVERIQLRERQLNSKYNDNLIPNMDPLLVELVDQAVQHILGLSKASGKPLLPYVAEAIYHRAVFAASGSFPEYVKRDQQAAFKDFEVAARNGYNTAWFKIGRDYERVNQIERARKCYERGVKFKETNCLYRMGMAHLLGQVGLPVDQGAAIPLLKRAADQSDVDTPQPAYVFGMLLLGEYSHVELSPLMLMVYLPHASASNVEPQLSEAWRYIERAAYLHFASAQCKAGWAYEFSKLGCPYDPLLSVQYYTFASQQGEEDADMALSKWFLCGADGYFEKDEHLAFTFAEKAARKDLSTAEFAMGYYNEVGVGCKADIAVARQWYMRASKHGNPDASERLSALNQQNPIVLSREEHNSLANNTLIRKHTLAREASKAAGRKATSSSGDGSYAAQAARRAVGTGPESSRPRTRPPSEFLNTSLNQVRARLRRPSPARQEEGTQAKLVMPPGNKNEPVGEGESVAHQVEKGTSNMADTGRIKPIPNGALPKRGPSTFEEMGYKSEALDDKDCIIM